MDGMMKYLRMLALFSGVLMCRDAVADTIFYSTANAGRNIAAAYNSNVDAYQDTVYTFTGGGSEHHELRGPFMLKGGFTINSTVNADWNAVGIVDGPMISSSGTLNLLTSLQLGPNGQFDPNSSNINSISGNGNSIFLGGDNTRLVATTMLNSPLTIDGCGHTFTVYPGGYFDGSGTWSLAFKNMTLVCKNGSLMSNIICRQPTSISNSIILNAPADGDYTKFGRFTGYTLTVTGDVRIEGFGTRFDNGNAPIIIGKNSTLSIGPGVALTGVTSLTMTDATSVLHLDGCNFYVGSSGLQMTKGTLILEDKVRIFNIDYDSDPLNPNMVMANGFVLGDGVDIANDVNVVVRGGASVIVDGCMWYNNGSLLPG